MTESTTANDLDFGDTLEPFTQPVRVGGKWYTLREASEDVAVRYRNELARHPKLGQGGSITSMGNVNDAEPFLAHLCLFEEYGESTPRMTRNVPLPIIRSWPARIVAKIVEKIKKVSGMETEADTEESLKEQISALEVRLEKVKSGKTDPNCSPTATPDTSI